jgi:hypothetical protein
LAWPRADRPQLVRSAAKYDLLIKNKLTVTMEPRLSAASYAYAAVLDCLQFGTLSPHLSTDMLRDQAAKVAVGLSSKTARWQEFREQIPAVADDRLTPFVRGIALGWAARWDD